jgi:hypothetical protein
VGLVIPKSLTYSYSWLPVRDYLLPSITHVVDVSEAWEEVLLEQVLVSYTDRSSRHPTAKPRFGRATGTIIDWTPPAAAEAVMKLGIIPTGLGATDTTILDRMLKNAGGLLEQVCVTHRGTGLQRLAAADGDIPVLGGREVADFALRPINRFIPSSLLKEASVRLTAPPTAVFQNIVAHVTRPQNHIKLTGCVVTDVVACLDTVNLVVPVTSDVSPWAVAAYLMSDLVNWFVHICVYNRAVRTMHFDRYFLSKIPFPLRSVWSALDFAGCELSTDPRQERVWRILNQTVYEAFGIAHGLAEAITDSRQPRWITALSPAERAPVTIPRREVPVADFAALAYPATNADRAVCAAALAVVEKSGGISSMEHLDALLLATHPDWCKAFLDRRGQAAFDAARRSAPAALFVGQGQSIRWKECRDYLEQLKALTVTHLGAEQPISVGTALTSVKARLPAGVDGVVECALMALARIRELRKDLPSVPQAQRVILDAFEEQHRLCGLAA